MRKTFPTVVVDVHNANLKYIEDMCKDILYDARRQGYTKENFVCRFIPSGKDKYGDPHYKFELGEDSADIIISKYGDSITFEGGYLLRHWVLDIDPRTMEL